MDVALKRLRWQCRRGMKELDLVLEHYLDTRFTSSSERDQHAFIELLKVEDDQLWRWLMGHEAPQQSEQLQLISVLQHRYSA